MWKDVYEASELALVLLVDKHLPAVEKRASIPAQALSMLSRVQALLPTHQTLRGRRRAAGVVDALGARLFRGTCVIGAP